MQRSCKIIAIFKHFALNDERETWLVNLLKIVPYARIARIDTFRDCSMEINPFVLRLKDLSQRGETLRGYL
ncbi:MAG: hypothetical protein Q4D05_05035 [Acinetobacter sp.]|nr:hypothetical protein [Acinetobacter sp.]